MLLPKKKKKGLNKPKLYFLHPVMSAELQENVCRKDRKELNFYPDGEQSV